MGGGERRGGKGEEREWEERENGKRTLFLINKLKGSFITDRLHKIAEFAGNTSQRVKWLC